jgi:hypothetical protein
MDVKKKKKKKVNATGPPCWRSVSKIFEASSHFSYPSFDRPLQCCAQRAPSSCQANVPQSMFAFEGVNLLRGYTCDPWSAASPWVAPPVVRAHSSLWTTLLLALARTLVGAYAFPLAGCCSIFTLSPRQGRAVGQLCRYVIQRLIA